MCRRFRCSSPKTNRLGQETTPGAAGTRERWLLGWGNPTPFLCIPGICLFKQTQGNLPKGDEPPGISCRQLQLLSLQHRFPFAADKEENNEASKRDSFPSFKDLLAFSSCLSRLLSVPAIGAIGDRGLQRQQGEAQPRSLPLQRFPLLFPPAHHWFP